MKHCVSNTTTDIQMRAECSTACVYHNFHVCMYVNNSLWEGLQMVKLGRRPPEGNRRCWEAGEWTRSYRVGRAWDREEGWERRWANSSNQVKICFKMPWWNPALWKCKKKKASKRFQMQYILYFPVMKTKVEVSENEIICLRSQNWYVSQEREIIIFWKISLQSVKARQRNTSLGV